MTITSFRHLFLFILCLAASGAFAQQEYSLQAASNFSIKGSSNIRDWEVNADDVTGSMTLDNSFFKKSTPKKGAKVTALSLKVPVADLDGGRGETMNGKIRKALQSETHPHVTFKLGTAQVSNIVDKAQGIVDISAQGTLTIGGVAQAMSLTLKGQKQEDGTFHFTGSKDIKMSQFKIERPSALFGQLVTNDDLSVTFTLVITP